MFSHLTTQEGFSAQKAVRVSCYVDDPLMNAIFFVPVLHIDEFTRVKALVSRYLSNSFRNEERVMK